MKGEERKEGKRKITQKKAKKDGRRDENKK
jgi:hypothetical protein